MIPGGVAGIDVKWTERKKSKNSGESTKRAANRESWSGGRPRNTEQYVVHRLAELFRYADGLPFSRLKKDVVIEMGDGTDVLVTNKQDLTSAIGELLCDLKPEARPHLLRQLAKLEKKRGKSQPDKIAEILRADKHAQAELRGFVQRDKPKHAEIEKKYGGHLDRRAVRQARVIAHPGKRGAPHGRRQKKKAARVAPCGRLS